MRVVLFMLLTLWSASGSAALADAELLTPVQEDNVPYELVGAVSILIVLCSAAYYIRQRIKLRAEEREAELEAEREREAELARQAIKLSQTDPEEFNDDDDYDDDDDDSDADD